MNPTFRLLRIGRGAKGTTEAQGVELTDAEVLAQTEAGPNQLDMSGAIYFNGICSDNSGNLYCTDYENHIVFKVSEGGKVSLIAGKAGESGNNGTLNNVPAADARFNRPYGIACDKSGTLYVTDFSNHQIRTIKGGKVNVLAGAAESIGLVDGNGLEARFNYPIGIAVDKSGIVYVVEEYNHTIRKISSNGDVLTIAGNGIAGDAENVQANKYTPTFNYPTSISVDSKGNIFVGDGANYKIKKITPNGWIYLHSGAGVKGIDLGTSPYWSYTCKYNYPSNIKHDDGDNLYVLDWSDTTRTRILRLNSEGRPFEVADFDSNSYTFDPNCMCITRNETIFVGMSS